MTGEAWAEAECVWDHAGASYEASGASWSDDRACVYVGLCVRPTAWHRLGQWWATDWHGNRVGYLYETGVWRAPGGWMSGWMHSYRLVLNDGREYSVRCSMRAR